MANLNRITGLCALCGALLGWAGCSNGGCLENRSAIPRAAFFDASTGKGMTLDSLAIGGIGAPGDSLLVSPGTEVGEVYLPMRSKDTKTSWCIAYKYEYLDFEEMNDTLTFAYESIPYFASEECGAAYRYRITSATCTRHIIDSIAVTDSLVTNVDKVYVNIYFRTTGEGEEQ